MEICQPDESETVGLRILEQAFYSLYLFSPALLRKVHAQYV